MSAGKENVQTRSDAPARLPPVGFWSYARQDDELSDGRLSRLRALLLQELQQQYGREQVRLFQDAETIPHGSDWEREIRTALDASSFFIPIVTPNFVQSEWCTREVELFLARENELTGRFPDLGERSRIFPILFIGIDDVDAENPETLAALQKRQWFDFRRFRHRNFDDAAVREAIAELAGTMRALLRSKVGQTSPTQRQAASAPVPDPPAPTPPRAIGVGDLLNHIFEVKRFIKAGGMGQVFEGANVNTGERVAIKVLLPALAADPKVAEMFQREALTLTRLNHEALVQYRVLAKEPQLGALYIVTEFVDGEDLGDALRKVDRSDAELRRLLGRLAAGLAAAHRLGAIHRDISPDNVMLPAGDIHEAKIIDFGIAKDLGGNLPTLIGQGFAGKLNYVAPEQLGEHGGEIGPWTDVYSLGLLILSVAGGKKVDMSGSFADAIRKRREGPDLTAAPEGLRPLLADMLKVDPTERLRSMEAVIARLAEPPPASASAPAAPAARKTKLKPAPAPKPVPLPVPDPEAELEDETEQATVLQPVREPAALIDPVAEPGGPARIKPWLWIGVLAVVVALALFIGLRPREPRAPQGPPVQTNDAPTPPNPATAAPQTPGRSWAAGRWCVDGNPNNVQIVRIQGNRVVTQFSGQRQTETIQSISDGSFVTDKATWRRTDTGLAIVEPGFTTNLRRCG